MLRSILQSIEPVLFLDSPLSLETNLVLFAGWEDLLLFQSFFAWKKPFERVYLQRFPSFFGLPTPRASQSLEHYPSPDSFSCPRNLERVYLILQNIPLIRSLGSSLLRNMNGQPP